jgi:DNA-directed RNA polymerase subunit RPC12/RpoP
MSLVNCSECGREISDRATACPGCGNPMAAKATAEDTSRLDRSCDHPVPGPLCSSEAIPILQKD